MEQIREPGKIQSPVKESLYYLREYFFPFGCGSCGTPLLSGREAYFGLCDECRSILIEIVKDTRCKICGKPLITEKDTCLSCREAGTAEGKYNNLLERMKILFPYTGRFRTILGSFKFKKSLGIGNFFALCLNLVIDESEPWAEEAVWVPVPPRPGKIRKQGWDQIEFLAALLEKVRYRGLAVNRCLKRLPSKTQKKLNREERSMNLKGRIICVKKPPKIAVLFDDVITTGATLDVCAAALLEGGAEKVYGVCLFYD